MIASLFLHPPKDFHPTKAVASCYCEWEDKILLLKRHPATSQGNTWGLPAGKLEKDETPREAIIREVKEETGLHIDDHALEMIGTLYCRLPHVDFLYHMFRKPFDSIPQIRLLLTEHVDMKWVTIEEALQLPLIAGGADAFKYYKQYLSSKRDYIE